MPEAAARASGAEAARSLRLTLPLRVGAYRDVIELEGAHVEWLVRTAAYVAIRDGRAAPPVTLSASLVPGTVADRHGDVLCLDSLAVALSDHAGRAVARIEFPRSALEPFVTARAVHRVVESGAKGTITFASSLHAVPADEPPWPVDVPALPSWPVERLARRATAVGTPADGWIATFVDPDVLDGFDVLEQASRAQGVEAAGRIHTRVGFDRRTRTFVRVLERLVVTRDAVATGSTVVSSGGSWAEFLATAAPGDGPPAHVHTHLHLAAEGGGDQESEAGLHAGADPLISISDKVTHLTRFGHPMAAGWIVSLYPDCRVVKLYELTPGGVLAEQPGWWVLPRRRRRNRS
jgi:hypothetical protein